MFGAGRAFIETGAATNSLSRRMSPVRSQIFAVGPLQVP